MLSQKSAAPSNQNDAYIHPLPDHDIISDPLSLKGQAALEAAERGYMVFPCQANGKAPITKLGHKNASCDLSQVKEWWTKSPHANVGLSLQASGLVAVDVDSYKPDCEWNTFSAGLDIPDTTIQISAREGTHYIFAAPHGVKYAGTLCKGVDIKRDGYILLEPSTFGGGTYRMQTDWDDLATAPDWMPVKAETTTTTVPAAASKLDRAKIVALLETAQNDLTRDGWVKVCFAAKGLCGDDARDAFLAFSYRYHSVNLGEPETLWDTARPDGSLSVGTLVHFLGGENSLLKGADLSDDALALELGLIGWNKDARFNVGLGKWYLWNANTWQKDGSKKHLTQVREYLRGKAESLLAYAAKEGFSGGELSSVKAAAKALGAASKVQAVESLARSNPDSATTSDCFDKNLMLLGTPSGTVDLKTGILHPPERSDLITKSVSVSPALTDVVPTKWLAFLDRVFDGDQEKIAFMQRSAGYALTGKTTEHKLLFLYGSGRNGKGVFTNTLSGIWGDYNRQAASEIFLKSSGDRHATGLAGLHGARLVLGSELPRGKVWNEAVIKDLTGGDIMSARLMRQDFFDFMPQLTLMISGNTQPDFQGVDEAIRSRVVLVPFNVTIPENERDPNLAEKLREEWPAILRWCIDGCLEWQKRGLDIPESIKQASAEYFEDQDWLGQFLSDETSDFLGGFILNCDLKIRFSEWLGKTGADDVTFSILKAQLKERGYASDRRRFGRGVSGLKLN